MKTGGRSLSDAVAGACEQRDPGSARVNVFLDEFAAGPPEVWAGLDYLSGHLSCEALDLLPSTTFSFTVVREPVERTLSHFAHVRGAAEVVEEWGELTLEQFLEEPRWRDLAVNYQARHLVHEVGLTEIVAGRSSPAERFAALGPPFPAEHELPLQSLFDCGPMSLDGDDLLSAALGRLGRLDLVGTTEHLDDVAAAVMDVLGLPRVRVPHLHATPGRPASADLDPALRRRIEEVTAVDRELHRLVGSGRLPPRPRSVRRSPP